jgi:hypothetical protein
MSVAEEQQRAKNHKRNYASLHYKVLPSKIPQTREQ